VSRRDQALAPVAPRRLYQQIADSLRDAMDRGLYPPGSHLPPERELAERMGVSRTSVREAMIALEVQGRVSVRVGVGVQVLSAGDAGPEAMRAGEEPLIGPLELLEARLVVEPETAMRAAGGATARDVALLRALHTRMIEEHARGRADHAADRAFHQEIARVSGNAALALIVDRLWDQRQSLMQARLEVLFGTPERFTAAQSDHLAILEAIAARDPAAAREAMRRHIARVQETLSRAIEREP